MPPYARPALCHPTLDLPYASNLPYTTLHQTFTLHCPTLMTYLTLTTYPTLSSLSICELPLAATPSAPSSNLQVHERFLFRMVPHRIHRWQWHWMRWKVWRLSWRSMGLLSKGLWPNFHPFESQKCCLAWLLSHLPPLMCHDSTGGWCKCWYQELHTKENFKAAKERAIMDAYPSVMTVIESNN